MIAEVGGNGDSAIVHEQFTLRRDGNIARWAQENNFYLEAGSLDGTTPTFFIAVLAGLLSFLLPCVLPLVPAMSFT